MRSSSVVLVFGLLGLALALAGCDSSGRREVPGGEPSPPATTQPTQPPDEGAAAEPPPTLPAGVSPPAEIAEPVEPVPDYIRILERYDDDEPGRVHVELTPPRRLAIETFNVRRLRIERSELPMATGGSLVLRLDGQVIEWTAGSAVVEWERSVNGVWVAVHE